MSGQLFIKPSQVIKRLRDLRTTFQTNYEGFPTFEIFGVGSTDIVQEQAKHESPIALYVMSSSATNALLTLAGATENDINSGVDVILVLQTSDVRDQTADELSIYFREFLVRALTGWEPWDCAEPMIFVGDVPVTVQGHALYLRGYTFAHQVRVDRSDLDDSLGTWDDLEDFLSVVATYSAITPDFEDETDDATITVDLPGPA